MVDQNNRLAEACKLIDATLKQVNGNLMMAAMEHEAAKRILSHQGLALLEMSVAVKCSKEGAALQEALDQACCNARTLCELVKDRLHIPNEPVRIPQPSVN